MAELIFCVKKDIKEYVRTYKHIIFSAILAAIFAFVLITTLFFPELINQMLEFIPEYISDASSLSDFITKMFPQDLAGNIGIFASSICTFYVIAIVLMVQGLLPSEITSGRWIIPVGAGYKKTSLITSKTIVYSLGTSIPVFVFYNLYYIVLFNFLDNNYQYGYVLLNSIVLMFGIALITALTILLSAIFKNGIIGALMLLVVIMVAPDILTFFSFGKYFPTYIFNYVYLSGSNWKEVIIPVILCVIIVIIVWRIALIRANRIEVGSNK